MWLSELAQLIQAIASVSSVLLVFFLLEKDFRDFKQFLRDIQGALREVALDVREIKGMVSKGSSKPMKDDPPKISIRTISTIIGGMAVVISVLNFFSALIMILIGFSLGVIAFGFFLAASLTGVYYSYYDEVKKAIIFTLIGLAPWVYTIIVLIG